MTPLIVSISLVILIFTSIITVASLWYLFAIHKGKNVWHIATLMVLCSLALLVTVIEAVEVRSPTLPEQPNVGDVEPVKARPDFVERHKKDQLSFQPKTIDEIKAERPVPPTIEQQIRSEVTNYKTFRDQVMKEN